MYHVQALQTSTVVCVLCVVCTSSKVKVRVTYCAAKTDAIMVNEIVFKNKIQCSLFRIALLSLSYY